MMSTPRAARCAPGRFATQASSQISKPIRTPPQSNRRSPIGTLRPPIASTARRPDCQGRNQRGS